MNLPRQLTPEKALIFRISHLRNLPWILDNGLCCRSSASQDPDFVPIGNQDVIEKRPRIEVPIAPEGTLSDYVPFHFTPYSPMLYNIITGRGVPKRDKSELCVLVSSLHDVRRAGRPFVFTDRHALLQYATRFSSDLDDLPTMIAWDLLQERDFRRDPEHPEKVDWYQAEALVYEHLPVRALLGIVVHNDEAAAGVHSALTQRELTLDVRVRPTWFF